MIHSDNGSVLSATSSSSSLQTISSFSSTHWDKDQMRYVRTPDTELSTDLSHTMSDNFVLIVGGLGYIGSHTAWELLKSGQNIIIIDNFANSGRMALESLIKLRDAYFSGSTTSPVLDFYRVDYRSKHRMREILGYYEEFGANYLEVRTRSRSRIVGTIHFAAYKAVSESFRKPLEYYANNVGGLIEFCELLSEFDIKNIVFSSSATVYGDLANAGGRLYEEQCDSSGCQGLTNPYGRTKWMSEAILSDLAKSDSSWKIVSLRYFNPVGCDESGRLGEEPRSAASNLMPVVVRAMTGDIAELSIFGSDWDTPDGTAIRDFIHVSDLAEGHLAALKAMNASLPGGYHVFNLGTGTGHSVKEIVSTMETIAQKRIPTRLAPRREGDVAMCIADPSKSAKDLKWSTRRSLARACWDICKHIDHTNELCGPEQGVAATYLPLAFFNSTESSSVMIDDFKNIVRKEAVPVLSSPMNVGRKRSKTLY